MYDFLVGRFLSLSCGRPPTGQKERIVLDSIERSVGYGAICEEMSLCAFFTTTLFLPSRTWFVFDALIGLDAWFLSRATDFRCGTRAELMAHFTTLSPSWDILLSLKRLFLSWDKWNCLLKFELLRILFTLYDTSSVASILLSCLPLVCWYYLSPSENRNL